MPAQGPFTGLSVLDSKGFDKSPVRVKGTHLTVDRPNTITCSVRKGGVTISIDDKKVFDWKGNLNRLTYGPVWATKTPKTLLVGAWTSRVRFTKITLTPITGTGKKLR